MNNTEMQNHLNDITDLLAYAAADVKEAVQNATETGDSKGYFQALERLDVATRCAVQATQALASIWNIQNGIKPAAK